MKIKIFFLISAMNALSYLCFGNCCKNCCGDCWKKSFGKEDENKKEKIEEQIFLEEEKGQEESKNFVNKNWLEKKKPNLKLYKKTELGGNEKIKVTKYKNGEIKVENFKPENDTKNPETNTHKWALFEIKYKEEEEKEDKFVYLYCSDIESKENDEIFNNMEKFSSISVLACDTSSVKNMNYMFYNCYNLEKLNLSNFDTSNVTNMQGMFARCSSLENIKFPDEINTSNVEDMGWMFFYCVELENLDLSKFDTSKVENMLSMFDNCKKLNKVIVSKDGGTKNKILKQLNEDIRDWKEEKNIEENICTLIKVEEKKSNI